MDNYSCKYRKLMYGSIVIFTIISAFLKFNVLGIKLKSSSLLLFIFLFFLLSLGTGTYPENYKTFFRSFLTVKFYDILFLFLSLFLSRFQLVVKSNFNVLQICVRGDEETTRTRETNEQLCGIIEGKKT